MSISKNHYWFDWGKLKKRGKPNFLQKFGKIMPYLPLSEIWDEQFPPKPKKEPVDEGSSLE